jgi:hypothetical protein
MSRTYRKNDATWWTDNANNPKFRQKIAEKKQKEKQNRKKRNKYEFLESQE